MFSSTCPSGAKLILCSQALTSGKERPGKPQHNDRAIKALPQGKSDDHRGQWPFTAHPALTPRLDCRRLHHKQVPAAARASSGYLRAAGSSCDASRCRQSPLSAHPIQPPQDLLPNRSVFRHTDSSSGTVGSHPPAVTDTSVFSSPRQFDTDQCGGEASVPLSPPPTSFVASTMPESSGTKCFSSGRTWQTSVRRAAA